jgi:hypothetical protein
MNDNCLKGMKCPKCSSESPFRISARCMALVFDSGVDSTTEFEWKDDDLCRCSLCDYVAEVKQFRIKGAIPVCPHCGNPEFLTDQEELNQVIVDGNGKVLGVVNNTSHKRFARDFRCTNCGTDYPRLPPEKGKK